MPVQLILFLFAVVNAGVVLHGVGWREPVVVWLAVSCAFTFGLFFATAVFATGPVLMEAKVGALSTIVGGLIATAAALLLAVRPFRAARI